MRNLARAPVRQSSDEARVLPADRSRREYTPIFVHVLHKEARHQYGQENNIAHERTGHQNGRNHTDNSCIFFATSSLGLASTLPSSGDVGASSVTLLLTATTCLRGVIGLMDDDGEF